MTPGYIHLYTEAVQNVDAFSLLIFAVFVLLAISLRATLKKTPIPPLVGFILLGVAASALNARVDFLSGGTETVLAFLEQLGIAVILFRVGLESNLRGLLAQLRRASFVWVLNVALAMLTGYLVARLALGLALPASLYIMVAFAATSVGITVAVWQQENKLETPVGELLVDVAELDDISSVIFMVVLFGLTPVLAQAGTMGITVVELWQQTWPLLLALGAFLGGAVLFSIFLEKPVTSFFGRLESAPSFMITVLAIGLIIASLAGIAGFSLAIGSFFAGLIFSRDPRAVHTDARFEDIYELFAPFFFIGIGLSVEIEALLPALGMGLILGLAAMLSKIVGAGLPVRIFRPWPEVWAVGLSMTARAEITMLVLQRGHTENLVSAEVYGAMIVVVLLTASLAPILARPWVRRVAER